MIGHDDTPGIADHLNNSVTVWDSRPLGNSNEYAYRQVFFTFFQNNRACSLKRFYVFGTPKGGGGRFISGRPDVFPNSAAAAEALPDPFFDYCVPNTEEFLSYDAAIFPLPNLVDIAVRFIVLTSVTEDLIILACDSTGRLYAGGYGQDAHKTSFPANPLGMGKQNTEIVPLDPPGTDYGFSPARQPTLQRVYGENDAFGSISFKRVGFCGSNAGVALASDGHIWMSGDVAGISKAADFPENDTKLPFFRKREITEWYDSGGVLQTGSALEFVDIWCTDKSILALTNNDKLFVCGNFFRLGRLRNSEVFHEIAGFVDSISVDAGGSSYSINTTATVSAPPNAQGQRATVSVVVVSGVITKINIVNPGWGYDSPPTITLANTGLGTGASFTCNLFSDTWQHCAVSKASGDAHYAAVSSAGVVYTWGANAIRNNTSAPTGFDTNIGAPRRANETGGSQPATYEKVFVEGSMGIAIADDGKASFWGRAWQAPDGTSAFKLTTLASVDATIGAYTFVGGDCIPDQGCLVRDDNSCYTWGLKGETLCHGAQSIVTEVSHGLFGDSRKIRKVIGSSVWLGVRGGSTTIENRTKAFFPIRAAEELDQYGMRVNPLPPYS